MKTRVLDQGYVKFIEAWGIGESGPGPGDWDFYKPDYEVGIIEAARQSTQGLFRGWEEDQKLLEFLYKNKHATPFEFSGCVLEIQAPIAVFREWHRHRTQSYNEMSARYAPLPDLYYMPDLQDVIRRGSAATANKQAQGIVPFDPDRADEWRMELHSLYAHAERVYQARLAIGIPKELARLPMPVGHYSRMRASANLRNWLAFLTLRLDPAAQEEIRTYARAVGEILAEKFPRTMKLFGERK